MKTKLVLVLFLIVSLMAMQPTNALPTNESTMNARFVKWQQHQHIIHIVVHDDNGRPGFDPAEVTHNKPILFGYEFGGATLEELQTDILDNPNHDVLVSIDAGTPFSVKSWYQTPFVSETQVGPHWSWDHDGDGPGDRDRDGFGDWLGSTLFFRYQIEGFSKGMHTVAFIIPDFGIFEVISISVS